MRIKIFILLLAAVLLAACSPAKTSTPTVTAPTNTPEPTVTATPPVTPLTILVLPADLPSADYDRYQTLFYNLAQASGMRFQVRNSLSTADAAAESPALKVVVALPPDPGLAELAAAAPSTQFLAVNIPGLTAGGNLSTVGANGAPVDQQAFLGGYITGLVAPEWKVGILYQKDTPEGDAARNAFINGFTFFCGTCRSPNFPQPAGIYPYLVGIPTDTPTNEYSAWADLLRQNVVKAAYVFPAEATPEVLNNLFQHDIMVIGESLPSGMDSSNWIASIQPDLDAAVKNIFPQLVEGKGGQSVPTPLFLNDVNSSILTEGKLRLAQEVLQGLQDGTISTGVAP